MRTEPPIMRTDSPIMRTQRPFFRASFFFEKKTAQILKIWPQKTKFYLIWGQGGRFRPYFALYRP